MEMFIVCPFLSIVERQVSIVEDQTSEGEENTVSSSTTPLARSISTLQVIATSEVDTHTRGCTHAGSLFQGGFVTVNDLCLRDYDELRQQFRIFPRTTLTIAIFYSLPVIQLVLQYQINVDSSGNEDLCYFNFLCTRQLAMLTAFNNVFSNIGYCALGLLFFIIVYRR